MRKIFKTIGFHKLKNEQNKEALKMIEGQHFLVWFNDNTCEEIYEKDDLIDCLEKDNKKRIRYIFDMIDRIVIDRDVKIENIKEEK